VSISDARIHDQGYRHYGGGREPQGRRWWVIGRAGIMARVRERRVIAVLLAAWLPFLVRAVQIYASANFQQVESKGGFTCSRRCLPSLWQ